MISLYICYTAFVTLLCILISMEYEPDAVDEIKEYGAVKFFILVLILGIIIWPIYIFLTALNVYEHK